MRVWQLLYARHFRVMRLATVMCIAVAALSSNLFLWAMGKREPKAQKTPPQSDAKKKKKKTDALVPEVKKLRGPAARLLFLVDVAAKAEVSVETVRRILDGMRVTAARNLRETSSCHIPGIARLQVRTLPQRAETTKIIKGKPCVWKARPKPAKKIRAYSVKQLSAAVG